MYNPIKFQKVIICLLVFSLFFTLIPRNNYYVNANKVNEKVEVPPPINVMEEKNINKRIEIPSMRSETSKTFLNPDNTYTTEILEKPIHYQEDPEEEWKIIDNTLVLDESEQKYINKANTMKTEFNESASQSDELVNIIEGDTSISMTAVGSESNFSPLVQTNLSETEASIEANEVTYEDIYPNVDVKYTVGTDRVKEDIILKEKPSTATPTNYSFKIDLKGLTYEKQLDGRIKFFNKNTHEEAFYLEKPFMYDSKKPQGYEENVGAISFAEESISYEVEMKIVEQDKQLFVNIIPNREWLESSDRIYPVIIDPTIVKIQNGMKVQDTNIRSHFPNNTGGVETTIGVGLYQDSTQVNKIRSLLKFDLAPISPGTKVLDATLNMRLASVWNSTPIQVDLHEMKAPWTEAGATWNKRDALNPWLKTGGDFTTAPLDVVSGISTLTDLSINYKWNVPATIVHDWIHNPSSNKGLILKSNNETIKSWKKFVSSDDISNSEYSPVLAITYISGSRLGIEDYWTYSEYEVADGELLINLGTGNGVASFTDFYSANSENSKISFERFYNSKSTEINSMGMGWSFTGSETLTEMDIHGNIFYTDRDGTIHEFHYNESTKKYIAPAGTYLTLTKDGMNNYKLTDKFGYIYRFKPIATDYETSQYTILHLEYEQDLSGNKITYNYMPNGKLKSITSPSGQIMEISQGSIGISAIKFGDLRNTYHYNSKGQLIEVRKYKNSTSFLSTAYTYNSTGQLETITDANKNVTKIVYNKEFVHSVQQLDLKGETLPAITFSYNIKDQTSEVKDAEGGVVKYQLNDNYSILSITDALGKTISNKIFDQNYNVLESVDAKGNISKKRFDTLGNVIEEIDSQGNKVVYTYDKFSNMKSLTDVQGAIRLNYDLKGNLVNTIQPNGDTVTYTYDDFGNKTSVTMEDGSKELYSYDNLNNYQSETVDALGRKVTTITDSVGNTTSVIDAMGFTNSFTYDYRNLITSAKDSNGKITFYQYDNNENMISMKNAAGNTKTFTYDSYNQLLSVRQPMGEVTSMKYDNNGNRVSLTKPSSDVIESQYDAVNQLIGIKVNGIKHWNFGYDENGNLINSSDIKLNRTKSFTYDSNDNVTRIVEGSVDLKYGYNKANELISLTGISKNDVLEQIYTLDSLGRLIEIHQGGLKSASFNYTNSGNLSSIISANGYTSNYTYDKAQQISSLLIKRGNSVYLNESHLHDKNGNLISVSSEKGKKNYTYDSINQLSRQTFLDGAIESYEYDSVGNRTKKVKVINGQQESTAYSYNNNNQLTSVNGKNYSYDSNGNRIKDSKFIYVYNELDQLVETKDLSGKLIASYNYDEQGRRSSKTVNGEITNFHYGKGSNVLFETNNLGKVMVEYSYDENNLPVTMKINGELFHYLLNSHKDVIAITNNIGVTVANYAYDAWGTLISKDGILADKNPYLYAGYRYDNETQLYYLMARYYTPQEGVFLSRDPSPGKKDNPQTQNGYNYADNNPVMNFDPKGMWSMRKDMLANAIDSLLFIIPGIGTFNTHLRAFGRSQKAYKTLNGTTVKPKVEVAVKKYFTRNGIKAVLALQIFGWINTAFWTMANFSIGKAIAWGLGKVFRVEKRYAKQYIYWGKTVKVEYIVF